METTTPTPRAEALFTRLHGAVQAEMDVIHAEADVNFDSNLWKCWAALRDSLYDLNVAAAHLARYETLNPSNQE